MGVSEKSFESRIGIRNHFGAPGNDSGGHGADKGFGRGLEPVEQRRIDGPERLEDTGRFDKGDAFVVFPFRETGLQAGNHGRGVGVVGEHPPRLLARPAFGRAELFDQIIDADRVEIGVFDEVAALRAHFPDPSVTVIAIGMTQGDLVMIDDGIKPVRDVDRPVGTLTDIHRTETFVSAVDQLHRRRGGKSRALRHQRDSRDLAGKITGDDGVVLNPVGQVRRTHNVPAHALSGRLPDLGELHELAGMGRGDEARCRKTEVRPVAFHKERAPLIKSDPAGILAHHRGKTEGIEPLQSRIKAPESGGVAPRNAPRGLNLGKGVKALTEIHKPSRIEDEIADILMGVTGSESGEDDAFFIGPVVTVGVFEKNKIGVFGDPGAAVAEGESHGHVEPVGKERRLVGAPVAVGVFEDVELVVGTLPGLELGIGERAEDPESTAMIPLNRDGIGDAEGLVGKERDLEVRVHDEGRELGLRRRIGGRRGIGTDRHRVVRSGEQEKGE